MRDIQQLILSTHLSEGTLRRKEIAHQMIIRSSSKFSMLKMMSLSPPSKKSKELPKRSR